LQNLDIQDIRIWQSIIAKSINVQTDLKSENSLPINMLVEKLNYTHFVELLKISNPLARTFYEIQSIKNNWTIDQLKHNINSLLFERVGLSKDKEKMLKKLKNDEIQQFSDIIKNPYILEFLDIPERAEFSENDLEESIISHIQKFMVELGRGFCFEARQKRISFNNRHYRIDLVFYHRILKCHVLIDLKLGEFDHSDAGQMNLYLNYYKEHELTEGDDLPVGIVLCSQKDEALVHFATGGLAQDVFVSRYMLQLPKANELKQIIEEELRKFDT